MGLKRQSKIYNIILVLFFSFVICVYSANDMWKNVSTKSENVKLTILMYHGFTDGGKESDYVLDVKNLENDIVWLKTEGFTFVNTKDIADYVYKGKKLPEKGVILSFDDGYLNNYIYAYPIIKRNVPLVTDNFANFPLGAGFDSRPPAQVQCRQGRVTNRIRTTVFTAWETP